MARAIDGTWNSFLLNLSYLTLRDFQENKAGLNTLKTAVESQPTLTPPNEPLTPCDVCRFSPPSSGNGKPCCLCPADCRPPEGEEV